MDREARCLRGLPKFEKSHEMVGGSTWLTRPFAKWTGFASVRLWAAFTIAIAKISWLGMSGLVSRRKRLKLNANELKGCNTLSRR